MTIILNPSLFSIQELYDMEPPHKYDAIISAIDMDAIYFAEKEANLPIYEKGL